MGEERGIGRRSWSDRLCGSRRGAGIAIALLLVLGGPSVAAAAPPAFKAAASGQSNNSTSLTITKPSTVVAGDFLIAQVTVRGGTGTTITAPSGPGTGSAWVLLEKKDNGTTLAQAVYYKFAGASEPASYTWTFNAPVNASGGLIAYTGVNTTTPIDTFGSATGSGTAVTAPFIVTTTNDDRLVGFFGIAAAANFSPPSGMTERYDISSGGMQAIRTASEGADVVQASAGPTGTKTATASQGGSWVAHLVALKPAAAAPRTTSTNVTCAPNPVPVLGTTTCTATVSDDEAGTSTPQGTVTFTLVPDAGESGAFTPATGTCTLDPTATGDSNSCSVGYTPATVGDGTHEIGASYTPTDGIHAASSDPTPFALSVRARITSTNVTCAPNPVPVLGTTTCTATVSDDEAGTSTPQGTVTFTLVPDAGESGAFTPATGTCTLDPTATGDSNSCSVGYTPATVGDGTHEIGASYTPTDGIHAASSDPTPFALTVRQRTTSTSVSCTPSTIEAGGSTTCTATVSDADAGTSTPQGTVTFSATGSGNSFVPASCTLDPTATGDSNSCSVSYSSTEAATHTVTASYSGSLIHKESTGTTTVTVEPGPPANVEVSPPTAVNDVDTEHCVTAKVTDRFGNATPGITVIFSVRGSNTADGSGTTDSTGTTEPFCYTGVLIGITDVITAFADFNPENGEQDAGEPIGTATKIWRTPVSTPLCEVKITQGGWIIASNGDRASFGGNAQVSNTGEPTGQEEYQDHGPAQPMNVKSTKILAVLCTDDLKQATIFGLATIDGSGEFAYRIDVQDLAEPGVGQDTYRMRIGIYDSGQPGTLVGGNVQIHKL